MVFDFVDDEPLRAELKARVHVMVLLFSQFVDTNNSLEPRTSMALKRFVVITLWSIFEGVLLYAAQRLSLATLPECRECFISVDYGSELWELHLKGPHLRSSRLPRPHAHISLFSTRHTCWYDSATFDSLIRAFSFLPDGHFAAFPKEAIWFMEKLRKLRNGIHVHLAMTDISAEKWIAKFDISECGVSMVQLDEHFSKIFSSAA